MPDPVQNPQAQLIARHATASGITELLRGGSQIGQVASTHSNGRVDIQLQGRSFQFDAKGMPLKEGQYVQMRLSGGQVVLEQTGAQTEARSTGAETVRPAPLSAQLSQMGVQGPAAQVIAQALIQAGVPLDRAVMQELSNLLPQAAANQASALAFLFSRGLPISPSMATWALRLLSARPRIGHSLDRLMESLSDLENEAMDEEQEQTRARVAEISNLRERLYRHQHTFSDSGEPPDMEEIEAFIRQALASPESLLAVSKDDDPDSLGATVIRLLRVLLDLKPLISDPRLATLLQQATENTQSLHEQLASLAFRNIPTETQDQTQSFYIQIPLRGENDSRELEVAYYPRRDRDDAGRVELRVELSHLGAIHAGLLWEKPQLDVNLSVETEETLERIDSALNDLRKGLQQLGFHVRSLRVAVGEIPSSIEPMPRPDAPIDDTQLSGLDIRV